MEDARTIYLKVPADFLDQLDTDGHVTRQGGVQFFPDITDDLIAASVNSPYVKLYAITLEEVVYE